MANDSRLLNRKGIWHHYQVWECFQNGLYGSGSDEYKALMASYVLGQEIDCRASMQAVIDEWEKTSEHHLSKKHTNRRAWLGQAACCYASGANEEETRAAWCDLMTPEQRIMANQIADEVIQIWDLRQENSTMKKKTTIH